MMTTTILLSQSRWINDMCSCITQQQQQQHCLGQTKRRKHFRLAKLGQPQPKIRFHYSLDDIDENVFNLKTLLSWFNVHHDDGAF